jgi:hypothetical protein
MPLGLWKSKWEIHREGMERRDVEWSDEMARRDKQWHAEMKRRDEEWHAEMRRRDTEWRQERARSDERWDRQLAETRRFNGELLDRLDARLDENERKIEAALKLLGDEMIAMRREVHENTNAVKAQTEAILRLVDRFEEWDGRPPV